MKNKMLPALLISFLILRAAVAAQNDGATPERIRIGVDIRMGFQSCIDYWTPITAYLSKAIPEYRFVIVPLASHQDLIRTLEKDGVEFLALDPAMELMAEDRYGAAPLATMMEFAPGEPQTQSVDATCSGAIVRRADRSEIQNFRDLRGLRLAAVKPWSLTGWIAQWGLLTKNGIDPRRDLKQVVFEGTHGQVIRRVLSGEADAGVVDAGLLSLMVKNRRIRPDALYVIPSVGHAVPLTSDEFVASTAVYPGRLISKTAAVPDELASRVVNALAKATLDTTQDGMPCRVRWGAPSNYSSVRRLLQTLMGPQFAESSGFPLPAQRPAWLFPIQVFGVALGVLFLASAAVRHYYRRREGLLREQLQDTRRELVEVRAELQRINAILALAGCGIDIVDDDNQIVYADSSLEQRYGDWHGRKCHEYFCDSDAPCPGCRRPFPINEHCRNALDVDCSEWTSRADARAKIHMIEGESTRMIGVPFRDEGGRWLHARIHFPLMAFSHSSELQSAEAQPGRSSE